MKKSQFATSLVSITLAATFLSTSAFAEGNGSVSSEETLNTNQSLSTAKLLNKKDVLKIVETNIQGYLKTDEQTVGKKLVASEEFINLYDFENNLFAYMVPLLENGKEIGYVTVGAIEDGYATYEMFIDDQAVNGIKSKLKAKVSSKASAQVLFTPPFNYFLKVTEGTKEQYFDVSKGKELDISDKVKSNKAKIQQNYKNIRNEENKSHMNKLRGISEGDYYATVTVEDVRLVTESNGYFVPVKDGGTTYYGGNQSWYSNSSWKQNGCGPVAAANITQYLAQSNPSKYGKLYPYSSLDRSSAFIPHMNTLYNYLNPGLFGKISVEDFASDVESYARGQGVTLTRMTSSATFTLDNTATYIKNGLYANSPVATLNTTLTAAPEYDENNYEWHWMTITKYYRGYDDGRFIKVSTWGERRTIDYRVHFDAMKNSYVSGGYGLMWFM